VQSDFYYLNILINITYSLLLLLRNITVSRKNLLAFTLFMYTFVYIHSFCKQRKLFFPTSYIIN